MRWLVNIAPAGITPPRRGPWRRRTPAPGGRPGCLTEHLPWSPTTYLAVAPALFEGEGMVCFFNFIDPDNRPRAYDFFYQVFYGTDEASLYVRRGGFSLASGL